MAVRAGAALSTPDWEDYIGDPQTAGPFENRILYAMCRDNPSHRDPYVSAGKITAIGRIYAAAPERGAGSGRETGTLAEAVAVQLACSPLDELLEAISFADRFCEANRVQVVETHRLLVEEVAVATRGWSAAATDEDWSPRNQASFASKYLHFHRPNAVPIMDSYAKEGLVCFGLSGPFETYDRFCAGFIRHVASLKSDWTPRSIDTELVLRGRAHRNRADPTCRSCGVVFSRRPHRRKMRAGDS